MIFLKSLNLEDAKKEYEFFQSLKSENGLENDLYGLDYETFVNEAIPRKIKASQGIDLKEGHVPDTYYLLWDEDKIVGVFKLRHYLNDGLRNGSGHIGYGILPQYRRQGYGSKGLALALEICKKILPPNETEVYLSCLKTNEGSLGVMKKNGAYIHHSDDKEYYTRIKIR